MPALEARALLSHLLGMPRERLIAHPQQLITPASANCFAELAQRRQSGEPLAYLLGEKEFYGRKFAVTPAVLIPRPETELLVEVALQLIPRDRARALDLGTGSGCIAVTLALERPDWHLTATDASLDAIRVATSNADRLQASNVAFRSGNWFDAVVDQRFDLIVANPPYIAADDPHLDALGYEPRAALVADDNGLACLRTIIEAARSYLSPHGVLALEHGHEQGAAVRELFAANGWRNAHTRVDLAGVERVTSALV
ncbi:MAG: peptide chain release factor N(5)-glutamine methyltransferase [Burkholderiaceae bacterium]